MYKIDNIMYPCNVFLRELIEVLHLTNYQNLDLIHDFFLKTYGDPKAIKINHSAFCIGLIEGAGQQPGPNRIRLSHFLKENENVPVHYLYLNRYCTFLEEDTYLYAMIVHLPEMPSPETFSWIEYGNIHDYI